MPDRFYALEVHIMSRGLGEIERWVLVHAYFKLVTKKLPTGWEQLPDEDAEDRFYKSEVLLNYFDVKRADAATQKKQFIRNGILCKLKMDRTYRSGIRKYLRATKSLSGKGCIERWYRTFHDKEGFQELDVVDWSNLSDEELSEGLEARYYTTYNDKGYDVEGVKLTCHNPKYSKYWDVTVPDWIVLTEEGEAQAKELSIANTG